VNIKNNLLILSFYDIAVEKFQEIVQRIVMVAQEGATFAAIVRAFGEVRKVSR